jgi:hypothetical protein
MKSLPVKLLLLCGILASLIYIGSDIAAALSWPGYRYADQSVSELRAIGSPTRSFLMPILSLYAVLEIAFGFGVWKVANKKRSMLITSILLITLGMLDSMGSLFSLNINETAGSLTNNIHIIITALTVFLILLIIGFGATIYKKWFLFYSIGTILTLIVSGFVAFLNVQKFAAQQHGSWLGIVERINIYGYMLWIVVLASALISTLYLQKNKS